MPKYEIGFSVTGEMVIEVEAKSKQDAITRWQAGEFAELEWKRMEHIDWDTGEAWLHGPDGQTHYCGSIDGSWPEDWK